MKKLVTVAATLSLLAAVPSFAATPPYKLAPGKYCKGEATKKRAGQKKSDFATCVTNLAKLNKSTTITPSQACKGMSTKKQKGKKQSPFAMCVTGGKKLRNDQNS